MRRFGPRPRRQRPNADPKWNKFFDEEQKEEARKQEILEMSLADAGLSVRTTNALENKSILTVASLAKQTREDLLGIQNFGAQTLAEVRDAVDVLGVSHPDWDIPKPKKSKSKKKRR